MSIIILSIPLYPKIVIQLIAQISAIFLIENKIIYVKNQYNDSLDVIVYRLHLVALVKTLSKPLELCTPHFTAAMCLIEWWAHKMTIWP